MLVIAGYLNILIAGLHIIGLYWAHDMFAITGIGPEMRELAHIHPILPYLLTVVVAGFFLAFGLYGVYCGKQKRRLRYEKLIIITIASIYLLRGFGELIIDILNQSPNLLLEIAYSICAIAIGLLFLLGGLAKWRVQQEG